MMMLSKKPQESYILQCWNESKPPELGELKTKKPRLVKSRVFTVVRKKKPDVINKTYECKHDAMKMMMRGGIDSSKRCLLRLAQVFKSRYSVTQGLRAWFFYALNPVFLIGRGGISSIQNPLWERLMRRFCSGFEHPDCLQKQSLQKTTGEHTHA